MEKNEMMEKLIREHEDFIHAPKFGNSLNKLLAKTDNILENGAIGRVLLLSADQVEAIYQESITELKKGMLGDAED